MLENNESKLMQPILWKVSSKINLFNQKKYSL